MIETLILGITSFVGTNIDDMFINMLFFSEAETSAEDRRIVLGKYLGIGALIAISILGASGLQFLPQRYIGFLGLVPMCLGLREMMSIRAGGENDGQSAERKSADRMINTALITLANGADNIGVYVPLFAGFAAWQIALTVGVYLVLIAVWCFLGRALADLPALRNLLARYKAVIVPGVYIALGVYILLKNWL